MVIGNSHNVSTQILKNLHIFRVGTESELLIFHGFSLKTERKFLVENKQVSILHMGQHIVVNKCLNAGTVVGIQISFWKHYITGKGQKYIAGSRCFVCAYIGIFRYLSGVFCHSGRVVPCIFQVRIRFLTGIILDTGISGKIRFLYF